MSTALAIAAVTQTLRFLLANSDLNVTTKTPDQAALDSGSGPRVNLFLYHTMPNPAWRNRDIPGRVRPGERGTPPLALNLYYLLTAYGEEGNDLADQRVLGQAMLALHDRPILKANDVRTAISGDRFLSNSTLSEQVENVRIAADTLNIEEMSRLWTTFQTQYRVSAAYQAAVVLIESRRLTKSALPVAKRGEQDRGVQTNLGVDALLEALEYRPNLQVPKLPAARIGDSILLSGKHIPGGEVSVWIRDPKLNSDQDADANVVAKLTPTVETPGSMLKVDLSNDAGIWPAGMLTAELNYTTNKRTITSNALPIAIAPQLQTSEISQSIIAFVADQGQRQILQVSLIHPVGEQRQIALLLSERTSDKPAQFFQIEQTKDSIDPNGLAPQFDITDVPPGNYWVRLRVDGIDSLLMKIDKDRDGRPIVSFDETQQLEITNDV